MAVKSLFLPMVLILLSGCREEQLSLPVTHAAVAQTTQAAPFAQPTAPLPSSQSCYAYILLRPKGQRAEAVQARLHQADKMAAGLNPRVVSVDLVGDHANVLALQFSVAWPDTEAYATRISSLIEDYLSSADVQDYLCNSGFSEVRLSARGSNDRRVHPIWTARVTSEGLVKDGD